MRKVWAVLCGMAVAAAVGAEIETIAVGEEKTGNLQANTLTIYRFETANESADVLEEMVFRAVRSARFGADGEALKICAADAPEMLKAACERSTENFELWLDLSNKSVATKYIGVVSTVGCNVTVKACTGECASTCPNDCNGHGGCAAGVCLCDKYSDKAWEGDRCYVVRERYSGLVWNNVAVVVCVCAMFVSIAFGAFATISPEEAVQKHKHSQPRKRTQQRPPQRRHIIIPKTPNQ